MGVRVKINGPIGWISLDRPAARNALDPATVAALRAALAESGASREVRCVVLAGEGEAFSVGGDIHVLRTQSVAETTALNRAVLGAAADLEALPVPSIAALHGFALGGGLELALGATLRVAEEGTRLGLPEARIGLIPGAGGVARLPRVIPHGVALKLMLTGDLIEADEALRLGLVDAVAPAGELTATVTRIAERIAANGPLAVRAIRAIVRAQESPAVDRAIAESERQLPGILGSYDAGEGTAAFAERRSPTFEDR